MIEVMRKRNIYQFGFALLAALLAMQMTSAFAAPPVPHIDNRGFHGQLDLTIADHLLTRCPGFNFGQLYLGNSQAKDAHFMQTGVVPGGHYGRHDRARLERCMSRYQQ